MVRTDRRAVLRGAAAWAVLAAVAADLPKPGGAYVATGSLDTPHATQAAAADERFVYAISDSAVVKYDRATGRELAKSTGQAHHLNSGYLWDGKLYLAHSNYPRTPHRSDVRVLDPGAMELKVYHTFSDPPGSLTWVVRRGEHWWCHFAHYGQENARSVLVRYDAGWKEERRWAYPRELVADWGAYSLSGGVWRGDEILATGHDKRVLYRLRVPANGETVEVAGVMASPFPGQGIAADPKTGGLVGIHRSKKQVLFAKPE
jgi:hypothetical protein